MNRKEFVTIAVAAFRRWQDHNATLRSAALAFFIILPLPSVLLITVNIYALFYGQAQGSQQFIQEVGAFAGPTIEFLVDQLLKGASNPFTLSFGSFISVVFAVAGGIGAFSVLQDTFNVLWEVELPKKRSLKTRVHERSVPFFLVLGAAIIVVGWLEFTNLLFASINYALGQVMGTFAASVALFAIQILSSFATAALLFAIIFKEIPDVEIEWSDVWFGAIMTALIFVFLNNLIGFYLRSFPVTSISGVAGSLIILLLWIFIVCQFLLYGAQFSKCHAESIGSHSGKGEEHRHKVKLRSAKGKLEEENINIDHIEEQTASSQSVKNQNVASQFRIEEKEKGTTHQIEREQAIISEEIESSPLQPENGKTENLQVKAGENPPETNPQVSFSETESSDKSEKEYDLRLKWKTKKKPSHKKENST